LVLAPKNVIDVDFAKDLSLELAPSGAELNVNPPFRETTEPGCFAARDIVSIAKVVVASVAFGSFCMAGIVRQLPLEGRTRRLWLPCLDLEHDVLRYLCLVAR
jgi:gliotoxin/aspirochlorine biosynthesis thioredoxin reductase